MDRGKQRLGFVLATCAIALAFGLPLAPDAAPLFGRPVVLGMAGAAAALYLTAALFADRRAIIAGLFGALLAAVASLLLLNDASIAGSARAGFWTIVIAALLGVTLALVKLANLQK